ncbi:MAG: DUF4270 domain-containing protein [Bacteroidia bacterium]|nr:DUF4270 domain-containing protein [Bacteroidia bacterium]
MKNLLRNWRTYWVAGILGLSCLSCQHSGSLDSFGDTNAELFLLDTFQVEAATYLYDSLPSSGQEQILVGRRLDDRFGILEAKSYLQIAPRPFSRVPQENARFVSLSLRLNYTFYQGDTTRPQTIQVHKLTEKIEYPEDENRLYNTSQFAFEAEPIGSLRFTARPNRGDTLIVPLSDALGQEWLEASKLRPGLLAPPRILSSSSEASFWHPRPRIMPVSWAFRPETPHPLKVQALCLCG